MQKYFNLKHVILLLGLLLPAVWCGAFDLGSMDGFSNISIKEGNVQGIPRGSSIQASINGHQLTVVFTENLGQVSVEVSSALGTSVHYSITPTPNGVQVYIMDTGDYIVTFTLANGDEYYLSITASLSLSQILIPNNKHT